jgi:3-hydroxybutyryl-CoA dehydrogenase
MDKLLAKDVDKGKIQDSEAKDARGRVQVVPPEVGLKGLRDVDMVVEVCRWVVISSADELFTTLQAVSESLLLKQSIFSSFAAELRPDAILASNTSSISITKIAAAAIPEGRSAASEEGKSSASRVVGELTEFIGLCPYDRLVFSCTQHEIDV